MHVESGLYEVRRLLRFRLLREVIRVAGLPPFTELRRARAHGAIGFLGCLDAVP
jgi:hypothetical protein